jgi:PAS domain S-box-containing protein
MAAMFQLDANMTAQTAREAPDPLVLLPVLADALASMRDGIIVTDGEWRVVYYNPVCLSLLAPRLADKLKLGALVDPALGAVTVPADPTLPQEMALEDGRWINIRLTSFGGGHGLILRDITERKLRELEVQEKEELYRTVVNTQNEFVARFRPDGTLTFANQAYCRYVGLSLEAMMAPGFSLFDMVHKDDRERHDAHIKALTRAEPIKVLVVRTQVASRSHWEHWTDTGVFDADGKLIEIQAIGRDITREKEAEDALERQREALSQAEKLAALGSLLAGVAHELNNPLSIVVGYSGLLHDSAKDDATRRRAKEVHVAAERCARIIKTFLAMARSKPASRSAVDIETQIDSVLELTGYGLRTSGIEIVKRFGGKLPTTLADGDQLHQVFTNIVLNAQQAMVNVAGPRRLTIETGVREGMLCVTLADTGNGMPDHVMARIFEPFFTTKPQGVGTGIGLSVCMGIIEAHAGRITVDSTVGEGTSFTVTLPIVSGTGDRLETAEALPPLAGSVLVVDDEPAIADLVAMALRRRGISCSTATGGLDAIRSIESQNFDAVITDLRMADLGGDKLIEIIGVLRPDMVGRIIVMTGDSLGGGMALKHANVTVLEKPLDLDALFAALTPLLKVH